MIKEASSLRKSTGFSREDPVLGARRSPAAPWQPPLFTSPLEQTGPPAWTTARPSAC